MQRVQSLGGYAIDVVGDLQYIAGKNSKLAHLLVFFPVANSGAHA